MKLLKQIFKEDNDRGTAVVLDTATSEEFIITMPADRFSRFMRKFRNLIGKPVEVANGWIYQKS